MRGKVKFRLPISKYVLIYNGIRYAVNARSLKQATSGVAFRIATDFIEKGLFPCMNRKELIALIRSEMKLICESDSKIIEVRETKRNLSLLEKNVGEIYEELYLEDAARHELSMLV